MRLSSSCLLAILGIILASVSDTESFKWRYFNVRYKPITRNVDTKNTVACSASKPLFLKGNSSTITDLKNTGQSIQTNNQREQDGRVTIATGGPLGDKKYYYLSVTYYWASNATTGVTGTTIDNTGFPYGVRIFYKNEDYETFEEALKYPDGFVDLVFLFKKCSYSRIPFSIISRKIQKIAKAGSVTPVSFGTHVLSLDYLNNYSLYYTYTGKFLDTHTNKAYPSSTVIIFKPTEKACITQHQFDRTFSHLEDFFGEPLHNTLTHDSSELQTSLCSGVQRELVF